MCSGLLLLEGLGVAREGIDHSLLMALVWTDVSTVHAVTVLAAENLQMKALAVHFQAFGFAAVATDLLDFVNLLGLLSVASSNIKAHRGFGKNIIDDGFFIFDWQLDIHGLLAVFLGDEGQAIEGSVMKIKIILLGGEGAISRGDLIVIAFGRHQIIAVHNTPPRVAQIVIRVLLDYFMLTHQ